MKNKEEELEDFKPKKPKLKPYKRKGNIDYLDYESDEDFYEEDDI